MPERPRGWFGQQIRWRPEVTNPLIIGFLELGQRVSTTVTRNLHQGDRPGRDERFQLLVRRALDSSPLMGEAKRVGGVEIHAQVREYFGKPSLVNVDLVLAEAQMNQLKAQLLDPHSQEEQLRAYRLFVVDLLERVVQAIWDNPEMAPVGIRGRFVVVGEATRVVIDMTDLGYVDEIARPGDLYARLGSPASDPYWRP